MTMNKFFKALKNPYVFSVVSKIAIVLLGFLFSVIQSRYLGAALKGDISYVSSVTSITCIIFGFGIHQAYPYYKRNHADDLRPFFLRVALVALIIYSIFAIILSVCVFKDEKMIAILLITPWSVYVRIVTYLTMVELPNKKNATELLVNFIEVIILVVFCLFYPASFIIGAFLVIFKDILLATFYSYRWRSLFFKACSFGFEKLYEILKFGFFPMLALLMTTLNYRVDVIMLNSLSTNVAVGVYSVGVTIAERVWLIPDALKDVMVSRLAKGKNADEVAFVIRVCNTVSIVVVFCIIALGKPFVDILFGKEYIGAYQVIVVMMIGVFCMIYYKMIASYNIVQGKQIVNFFLLGLSVISNIIANYFLIPKTGMMGAAWASVISYMLCAILFIMYFCSVTGLKMKNILFIQKKDIIRLKELRK